MGINLVTFEVKVPEDKHTSQNGKETLLKDLALPHLKNIIAKMEQDDFRKYHQGLGKMLIGEDARVFSNYKFYVDELKRREENER